MDALLIAFALFTFGYGILFLVFLSHRPETARVPEVSVPESIAALKTSLMQVVIVILTVYFVRKEVAMGICGDGKLREIELVK